MLDFVVKEEGKEEEEEEACNENSWGWGIDVDEIWFEKKRHSKVYCWIRFRNIVSSFKNIPIKYKWHKRCRNSWKYYKTACEEYFSEIAEFELRFDVVKKKEIFLSWFIEPTKWKEIESREGIKQKIKSSRFYLGKISFYFFASTWNLARIRHQRRKIATLRLFSPQLVSEIRRSRAVWRENSVLPSPPFVVAERWFLSGWIKNLHCVPFEITFILNFITFHRYFHFLRVYKIFRRKRNAF